MNALATPFMADPTVGGLPAADELARSLSEAKPSEIIAAALRTVGRDKLAMKPMPIGSETLTNTMGIVRVSRCSATMAPGVCPRITSGCIATSSFANTGNGSARPAAKR